VKELWKRKPGFSRLLFRLTYLAEQQKGLLQFVLQNLGFNLLQRTTVHLQEAVATLAVSDGGGGFLQLQRFPALLYDTRRVLLKSKYQVKILAQAHTQT